MALRMSVRSLLIFGGCVSWFRYEEAVDDWLAKASIDKAERFAPLLKTRPTGDATTPGIITLDT